MVDNVTLNAGSGGDVIATEDIGGVEYQQVKLVDGTATSTTTIPLSGDLTNGLDVDVTRVGGTVTVDGSGVTQPVSGTVAVTNAGLTELAAAINVSSQMDVNLAASGVTVTVDGSAVTQPVSAASLPLPTGAATAANQLPDGHNVTVDNASIAVTNAGTFAVQVDGDALTAMQTLDNSIFADDAAFTLASSSVNMAGAIRDDALTTLTAVEGDAVPLRVSSTGALHVTGGGGGTEYSEDAATPATIVGTATMMERDDALSALTPIEGDWAGMRCDSQGALWVNAVNAGGTSNVDTAAGATDEGAIMLAVRDDSLTTLTPVDGDYTHLRVNSTGALHVTGAGGGTQYSIDDAAPTVVTMAGAIRDDALTTLTEADGDASTLRVSSTGALHVTDAGGNTSNAVSTNNSSTATLGISGVFTGTADDVSAYTSVTITVDSSHDSATDGMTFQFSTDNTNWDDVYSFTYTAANGARRFQFPVTAQYFRVVYTNGGTGQTHFRLQTILHRNNVMTSIHRLADDMDPDRSAQVVKSVLFAQAAGSGDFVPVDSNAQGRLQVSAETAGAETPADADATPTDAMHVQAFNSVYNGTTWDLVREGSTAGSILVDGSGVTQPVSGTITETNSAAILADTANMDTNLGTIAGAVTGTEMQVDVVTSALPTGAATAANQLPDGHNVTIDNATGAAAVNIQDGGNSITVDGTITANLSATDNAVLDQIELNTSYGDAVGGGTEAAALRVTLANDSTGVISIDDGGNTITVDGTVTANLGATDNAVLDDIAAHTSDPMTVAHDAAATGAANVNMAGARATNSIEGVTQVANGDATRLQADLNGVLLSRPHTTPEEHISERVSNTNGTSTAFTNFAAGGAGIHNYVTDITVYNSSATDGYVDIRDGTAGSIIWTLPLPATGGATHSFSLPLKGAANTALAFDVSAALTTVYISVNGFQAQG